MAIGARDFTTDGKPREKFSPSSLRWWAEKNPDEAAKGITNTLTQLKDYQQTRLTQHIVSARMYGNLPVMGLLGLSMSKLAASQAVLRDRISYNVVQSVIDTAQSKMARNKPKPFFLTSGGNYRARRKAKKLNKLVDGIFYENRAHDDGIETFRDGCVFGDGLTYVYEKNGRVAHERVLPSEIWVDEVEAFYGKPRQLHRVKEVDREVLAAAFPGKRDVIMTASPATLRDKGGDSRTVSDVVEVRQSWHLRSGPKAKDGCWVVTIDGHALTPLMVWEHDVFPFARYRWCPRLWGYWSQGIAEQIQNIQVEINKLLAVIQRSFHLGGAYKVFMEMGSKIVKEAINNDIGGIVYYRGQPPQYVVPPLVASEIYQHLMVLIQRAYEQVGISTMAATSTKPIGLNSGKALREFDDIGNDRQLTPGQRYQAYYLELARLDLLVARDIAKRSGGHYRVKTPGRGSLAEIDLAEADLAEEEYLMQCYPISSLPSDPAGRLQTIQEYVQAGFYTAREGRRLLDFPDMEQVETLANAAEEYLTKSLDRIVDDGEYTAPEPSDDLALADELSAEYYQDGKAHGLEEDKLDLLLTYRSQIREMQDQMAAEQAEMAMAAQAAAKPPAVPMPPPQSDLLPNVPAMAA